MRFIDLFCGIGGFRLGLEKADIKSKTKRQGLKNRNPEGYSPNIGREYVETTTFSCVYANDNDKYACQIYRKHWNDGTLHEGDIRTVDPSTIPDHDLLCAGFPCQSFSIAGKRRGFEDTRGTLFFEICRVLRAKRPSYLFLENVKGLLSHDDGRTFATILQSLDDLGYDCQWEVLNSKNFGVPQNRERVFIIGHTRGITRPKVFPLGETDTIYSEVATCLDSNYGKGWLDHGQRTMIVEPYIQNVPHGFNDGFRKRYPNIRAESSSERNELLVNKGQIRRLTPLECERLQGFPDGWTEKGIDKKGNEVGISDTQRYRALGNAVTVNVITAIGVKL